MKSKLLILTIFATLLIGCNSTYKTRQTSNKFYSSLDYYNNVYDNYSRFRNNTHRPTIIILNPKSNTTLNRPCKFNNNKFLNNQKRVLALKNNKGHNTKPNNQKRVLALKNNKGHNNNTDIFMRKPIVNNKRHNNNTPPNVYFDRRNYDSSNNNRNIPVRRKFDNN